MSALAFADSFFRESGTAVAIARLPALIGGGDWAEFRFVPSLLRSLRSGEPIVFRDGFGRSYAHVLDAARACLHLAENLYTSRPAISRGWDFPGPDPGEISEQDLAERFIEHWPGERTHRELHQSAAKLVAAKSPDPAKVYPEWTSALSLDEAIAWTMDWYKGYSANPASAWRMTETQIEQYAKLPLSWTLTAADHRQAD
jgi:CDP-glucose 4,6-dehydratase